MNYTVLRQHFGDKQYFSGDSRTITDQAVADKLLKLGVIEKADTKPNNKMAKSPQNKADDRKKDKGET